MAKIKPSSLDYDHTRRTDGTFGPGNPGGPGRPRRKVELEYLAALADTITPDEWRKICRVAVDLALEGDGPARSWVSQYLLGPSEKNALLDLAAHEAAGDLEREIELRVSSIQQLQVLRGAIGRPRPAK